MTLNPRKCEFRLSKLTFFGYELSHRGVRPSEEKIAAIEDALPPKDAAEAKSFLGLVQYLARFIPNMSSIAEPIQKITRHGTHFRWEAPQQSAFEELKRRMSSADTLAYFKADTNRGRCITNRSRRSVDSNPGWRMACSVICVTKSL